MRRIDHDVLRVAGVNVVPSDVHDRCVGAESLVLHFAQIRSVNCVGVLLQCSMPDAGYPVPPTRERGFLDERAGLRDGGLSGPGSLANNA